MQPADRKIILVVRETRLDELTARFNTVQQARFYVEHLGSDFGDYLEEQRQLHAATREVETSLRAFGRVQRLDRRYLGNFIFGADDIVVVLGQDGLVANTLKYLDGQHLLGVNPDAKRWDGVLLPFRPDDLPRIMLEEVAHRRPLKRVTMAKASLNTGETLYAVNDLFVGPRSHVSARYTLRVDDREEQQSSSVDRDGVDRMAQEPVCRLGRCRRQLRYRAPEQSAGRVISLGFGVPALLRSRTVPEPNHRRLAGLRPN